MAKRRIAQLLGVVLLALSACSAEAPTARNALIVTVDTLRADVLGAYGGPVATPAFDRLAAEGALLEGACTPTPSTGPAHASLFTGLYPWNHGVLLNASPLDDALPHLAVEARKAGLDTAAFVSSFVVDARWGFGRGFRHYHFDPSELWPWKGELRGFFSRAAETTDATLAWLRKHHAEPFLVWVHYFDPHSPYRAHPEHFRPRERLDMRHRSLPKKVESLQALGNLIRAYHSEVAYTDRHLGRLIEGLRELGVLDDTAVIVTSDHGEGLGHHGWLGHGRNLYDELVRVPLLVRAPGVPPGRQLRGAAQLEDLLPTTLSLLGIAAPADIDGVDLAPWLRGERADSPRPSVLGRMAGYPDREPLYYTRSWPEKWIGHPDQPGVRYDLAADPAERSTAPGGGVPDGLSASLAAASPPGAARQLDDASREALEALGYLGDEGDGTVPQP